MPGAGWRSREQGLRGPAQGPEPSHACCCRHGSPALGLGSSLAVYGDYSNREAKACCSCCADSSARHLRRPACLPARDMDDLPIRSFFKFEIFFIMLLMMIAGPNLIGGNLRFNALPLYFSRPLTAAGLPARQARRHCRAGGHGGDRDRRSAAYLLGICFSLDLGVIADTWHCCR